MFKSVKASAAALVMSALCACGGSSSQTGSTSTSTAHGTLALDPPFRIASVNAATFAAQLERNE